MKKAAPKKKAPVQLTAGTGFRNENCIGARFLLDLLAGTNTLGVDFGKIDRLQWQGRDLGWLADDLIVECTASTGKRSAGISIKSDRQVTSSGFPPDSLAQHGRNGSASRRSVSYAAATTLLSLWSEVLRMTLRTPGRIC
jgi:hypothetical protein